MTEQKRPLRLKIPEPDTSKWGPPVPKPKPKTRAHTVAYAHAIRNNPKLWKIFEEVSDDEWLSEEARAELSHFRADFRNRTGFDPDAGEAHHLLRKLVAGIIDRLE